MTRFAACFLLIFGQLSWGGLAALAVPPFFEVERGFYKSSASVYLGAGLLTAAGFTALAWRGGPGTSIGVGLWIGAVIWGLFSASLAIYLATLWSDNGYLRARSYTLSLAIGLSAVLFAELALKPASFGPLAVAGYGLSAVMSSAVLGTASAAMLFGHWYLIDPNLPVDYLRTLVRVLAIALFGELAAIAIVLVLFSFGAGQGARAALSSLLGSSWLLLVMRVSLGPGATLILTWMTWKTLQIPQTMAATGLLYVAVMAALVGEMLGRFILFRTALPL